MFLVDEVADTGRALGRYCDAILPAFDAQDLERLYADLFHGRLADEVNKHTDLTELIHQLLQVCANQGAHLVRLLARIVRVRAARRDLIDVLAAPLGLGPVIEIADLLVAGGCPEDLRERSARVFEVSGAQRKRFHWTGREAWIDVLVCLEEQPAGGRVRPWLLDYLAHVQQAWAASSPAHAAAFQQRLARLCPEHIGHAPDDEASRTARWSRAEPDPSAPPCALPVALLPGKHALMMATEAGAWFTIDGEDLAPLPPTGPFGAAVADATGTVTVACWDGSLKQLRNRSGWDPPLVIASPLALALTARGVVVGDASGRLTVVPHGGRSPTSEQATDAAVIELGSAEGTLAVLDSSGRLATTSWPARSEVALCAIDTARLGRPFALCAGISPGTLIAIGERGLAVLDGNELGQIAAEPAVREIVPFRGCDRGCVVTDAGAAWIADASLARRALLQLSGTGIEAAIPGPDGHVLAWTRDGDLLAVHVDGTVRRLAEGDVVLAAPDPGDASCYVAVHWSSGGRARVSRGRAIWT